MQVHIVYFHISLFLFQAAQLYLHEYLEDGNDDCCIAMGQRYDDDDGE